MNATSSRRATTLPIVLTTVLALVAVAAGAWAVISAQGARDADVLIGNGLPPSGTELRLLAEVDFMAQTTVAVQDRSIFVLPLLTPSASDATPAGAVAPTVRGALVFPGRETMGDEQLDALLSETLAMGSRGPVLRLGGARLTDPALRHAVLSELSAGGRSVALDAPILLWRPYPSAGGEIWIPASVAFGASLALFGMLWLWKPGAAVAAEDDDVSAEVDGPRVSPVGFDVAEPDAEDLMGEIHASIPEPVWIRPAPGANKPKRSAAPRLFNAVRLGEGSAEKLLLSRRTLARVDNDPFVQRLARLQ